MNISDKKIQRNTNRAQTGKNNVLDVGIKKYLLFFKKKKRKKKALCISRSPGTMVDFISGQYDEIFVVNMQINLY